MLTRTLAALVLLAAGCSSAGSGEPAAAEREAITEGQPDDHAWVVGLVTDGRVECSGSLVAPDVVLTAAHCVTPRAPDGVATASSSGAALVAKVARVVAHPGFDPTTLDDDVALAFLEVPLPLPTARLASASDEPAVGARVTVVGFGRDDALQGRIGVRRAGTSEVAAVSPTSFVLHPAPSQPCIGDSGGPTFVASATGDVVVGVHSEGDANCRAFDRDVRVDAYVASFIAPAMSARFAPGGGCTAAHAASRDAPWLFAGALIFALATLRGASTRIRGRT